MAWLEGTGEEFLAGDVFLRLRRRNTSLGKRMVQPRLTSNRRVATVCASIATQSHHAPRHVNQAGWERCCAPIVE
jgi:hypothetical protein